MKKTMISAAVAATLSLVSGAVLADNGQDAFNSVIGGTNHHGAATEGALSPATNAPVASYNAQNTRSKNTSVTQGFNDINSDNKVSISEGDGNVVFGDRVDQAVAASDMNATVSGNTVLVNSAYSEAALSPATNKPLSEKFETVNRITGSFSGAAGIAMVSQNTGHASSIEQGTLVQSNFQLQ